MKKLSVLASVMQRWSCHNCSGCCRQHEIEITPAEKARIEAQDWPRSGEIPAQQPLFEPLGGKRSGRFRLAHQPDGACVFLRPDGLCRIHARFGEHAKPLACRVYPYAFHPAGGRQVRVSLRFSCPSVIANRGRPVRDGIGELQELAAEVLPREALAARPPELAPGVPLTWSDVRSIVADLLDWLGDEDLPWAERLFAANLWLGLLADASRQRDAGGSPDDSAALARALARSVAQQLQQEAVPRLNCIDWTVFRQHVAFYTRADAPTLRGRWWHRWRLLRASLAWASGLGRLVPLVERLRPVRWRRIVRDAGGWPEGSDELWRRYFEVKLTGLHFAGAGFFGWSIRDGFAALTAVLPVTLAVARWRALSQGRGSITPEDLHFALSITDHNHGYSEGVGNRAARNRIRFLLRNGGRSLYSLCRLLSRSPQGPA